MQDYEFHTKKRDSIDLIVYHCGKEQCESSHSFGPAVRDHFLIHYILEGEGSFHVDGKTYNLKKHEGFLICPDVVTYYEADKANPWTYTWVGFYGIKAEAYLKAANLTRENPIFSHSKENSIEQYFKQMQECNNLAQANEIKLQGLLYLLLGELIESCGKSLNRERNSKEIYIKKSIEYIEKNYSRNISINDMSKFIGLNRSYLSFLFKSNLNLSPQEFLIKYRMNKAVELMVNPSLSISDISHSVGYEDPLTFSKVFKKENGLSPRKYKEQNKK